jgi:mRNA-degrading endonuclease RelE of RelBE toxin-antitoxin system
MVRSGDQRVIFEIDQSGTPIIVTVTRVEKRNEHTY